MSAPQAWFFGCIKGTSDGHAIYSPGSHRTYSPPAGCPWSIGLMDSGLLKNGKVPDVVDGKVRWTCGAADWHAFFWWDRSGDSRTNSNSGFYVKGFPVGSLAEENVRACAGAAFEFAKAQFPKIVARQHRPLELVDHHHARAQPEARP